MHVFCVVWTDYFGMVVYFSGRQLDSHILGHGFNLPASAKQKTVSQESIAMMDFSSTVLAKQRQRSDPSVREVCSDF